MQYLRPVGAGPSSNICPKWAPQLEQCASVRVIKSFGRQWYQLPPLRLAQKSLASQFQIHTLFYCQTRVDRSRHIYICQDLYWLRTFLSKPVPSHVFLLLRIVYHLTVPAILHLSSQLSFYLPLTRVGTYVAISTYISSRLNIYIFS